MTMISKLRGRTQVARLAAAAVAAAGLAAGVAACGSSSSANGGGASHMSLVAYSTPGPAYTDKLIPAFQQTKSGQGASFSTSFGASGDQSRAVEAGQPADVVHFSLLTDMERLVDDGIVPKTWDQNQYHGFVEDYKQGRLDEKAEALHGPKPTAPPADAKTAALFSDARAKLPHASPWPAVYDAGDKRFALLVQSPELATAHPRDTAFYP